MRSCHPCPGVRGVTRVVGPARQGARSAAAAWLARGHVKSRRATFTRWDWCHPVVVQDRCFVCKQALGDRGPHRAQASARPALTASGRQRGPSSGPAAPARDRGSKKNRTSLAAAGERPRRRQLPSHARERARRFTLISSIGTRCHLPAGLATPAGPSRGTPLAWPLEVILSRLHPHKLGAREETEGDQGE